ncbi:hypothetical protein Dda_1292 [Drechslerella dactyloides]|uniref:HNH nuclease domain-containing protein n=1 Tax=Drechslerella dactyloides TaxID=74499 RepID=A0AAD6NLV3_DREDA|nr:hypothetical protein Dda_1292 [Drechslerella dactyloides]
MTTQAAPVVLLGNPTLLRPSAYERTRSAPAAVKNYLEEFNEALQAKGISVTPVFVAFTVAVADESGSKFREVFERAKLLPLEGVESFVLADEWDIDAINQAYNHNAKRLANVSIRLHRAIGQFLTRKSSMNPELDPSKGLGQRNPSITQWTPRSSDLVDKTLKRDGAKCVLTSSTAWVEACHIIPYRLGFRKLKGTRSSDKLDFWAMLQMLLPAVDYTRVHDFLIGFSDGISRINRLENMLSLSTEHHKGFGAGRFILEPLRETITPTGYQARFCLLPALRSDSQLFKVDRQARAIPLEIPQVYTQSEDPHLRGQAFVNPFKRQFIEDGDLISLSTIDPAEYPLPNPDLLELHGILSRIARMAGRGLMEPDAYDDEELGPGEIATAIDELAIGEPLSDRKVLVDIPGAHATGDQFFGGEDAGECSTQSNLPAEHETYDPAKTQQQGLTGASNLASDKDLRKENRQE